MVDYMCSVIVLMESIYYNINSQTSNIDLALIMVIFVGSCYPFTGTFLLTFLSGKWKWSRYFIVSYIYFKTVVSFTDILTRVSRKAIIVHFKIEVFIVTYPLASCVFVIVLIRATLDIKLSLIVDLGFWMLVRLRMWRTEKEQKLNNTACII